MTNHHYLDLIWGRLQDMAAGRGPSAAIQLSTTDTRGFPAMRTVILRKADPEQATISFITDIRSEKVQHIQSQPKVCAVSYDLSSRVQIKLCGDAAVVQDEDARRTAWDRLKPHTRAQFEADIPPGVMLSDDGEVIAWEGSGPTQPYDRFALVAVSISSAEWLDVSGNENERYIYFRDHRPKWHGYRFSP